MRSTDASWLLSHIGDSLCLTYIPLESEHFIRFKTMGLLIFHPPNWNQCQSTIKELVPMKNPVKSDESANKNS